MSREVSQYGAEKYPIQGFRAVFDHPGGGNAGAVYFLFGDGKWRQDGAADHCRRDDRRDRRLWALAAGQKPGATAPAQHLDDAELCLLRDRHHRFPAGRLSGTLTDKYKNRQVKACRFFTANIQYLMVKQRFISCSDGSYKQ